MTASSQTSRKRGKATVRLSGAAPGRADDALSQDESARALGRESLIRQVQSMVAESGRPEGFDAAGWVAQWLSQPLPALDGKTPASVMDSIEGRKVVASLLAMAQSGAYA